MKICDRCHSAEDVSRIMISRAYAMGAIGDEEARDLCKKCEEEIRAKFREEIKR